MNPRPEVPEQRARILIVDDERPNRQLLELMLAPEGFIVQTAAGGEEALVMVAAQPPDLILLDVMMPGMNGYEVAARIKGDLATKNIPVIMVTALDGREDKLRGLSVGAEDFLSKPVDRAELCMRVRNLLRLKYYGSYYDKYSQLLEGEVDARTADLIERTRQAAVLAEQAALLDLAQDAIVVRDMHDRITFWSRGAEVMYGWPANEAAGEVLHELLKAEFSEPAEHIHATLLREGQWEGEAIHYQRDGMRMVVASRWSLQRDADGTPVRILAIDNDVTAHKRADSERRVLMERLSLATAVAKVGVWEWDLASNMLTWDATMLDIYDFHSGIRMPYAKWSAAVHPDDLADVQRGLRRAIDEKGEGSAEFRIVRADGSVRIVSAVERAVLDEQGNVSRLIGVDMDITDRKAAERELEQSRQDQLRYKGEFLSHVSHELRSPLAAIKQFSWILLRGLAGELNAEQSKYQQIVMKNIAQLQSMIDDLLEVTHLESGQLTIEPEWVSVGEAVDDVFDTLQFSADAKGLTLSCDFEANQPRVFADETRLRQILIILLDNAIKFTPNGGAVKVRSRPLQEQDPGFLLVEVSDNGCGFSPEVAETIFERLYQVSAATRSSSKGLGLGLYICKELVIRQGGRIWADGQPQKGSTFSFTLPVHPLSNSSDDAREQPWHAEPVASESQISQEVAHNT